MTFLPVVGLIVLLFIPRDRPNAIRWTSVFFTGLVLIIAIVTWARFDPSQTGINDERGFQFIDHVSWIPAFNIEYFVGVDGLSMPMVGLTALLSFLCIFASWGITKAVKGYFCMFLLLETGMIGTFVALDFFLFYVFWEVMLLPMYFLIGIWGGPRREYAAIKFFLYTLFGSLLMLLVMLAFYLNTRDPITGGHTFNMLHMMNQGLQGDWIKGETLRTLMFFALFVCFAIKIPMVPFHTWLPDAHVEAPTAVSVILAGILLKMGTYAILRINYPMLPDTTMQYAWFIAFMGMVNIVYGAFCAMAQTDLKRLVAYSSISHMGFVMLGMSSFTPAGINGAVFQMFNHGTITAMLFLLVGVIYDRAHHRYIVYPKDYPEVELRGKLGFGGLANQMPIYGGVFSLAFFAAMGLPGLSGFISEALCFVGAFPTWQAFTIISVFGIIITAGYILWAIQRLFLGTLPERWKTLPEINGRELFTLIPLAAIVVFLGVYPSPVLSMMNSTLNYLNAVVEAGAHAAGVMSVGLPF